MGFDWNCVRYIYAAEQRSVRLLVADERWKIMMNYMLLAVVKRFKR